MSNQADIQIDSEQVQRLFRNLSFREQKSTYKKALRKSSNLIRSEAKRSLKRKIGTAATHVGRWGKSLSQGIKTTVKRSGLSSNVHLMKDFRLKFFEMGTHDRRTRQNHNRGKMRATRFFAEARNRKEREAEDTLIRNLEQATIRIYNRTR